MYKSQADAIKEWLQAYQRGEKEINEKYDRLRTLKARMMSVPAQELSDMPRPPSSPKDRMAEYLIQAEALEKAIQYETKKQELCKNVILNLTDNLRKPEACKLIRYRYLYGYEWSDVMKELYGNRKDLKQKENAYRRKMYRLHQSALKELARLWIQEPEKQ